MRGDGLSILKVTLLEIPPCQTQMCGVAYSCSYVLLVLRINSKPKLTIYDNFYSFLSRNEHERSLLSPRFDEPDSRTYFVMQRRSVCAEVKPAPCKTCLQSSDIWIDMCFTYIVEQGGVENVQYATNHKRKGGGGRSARAVRSARSASHLEPGLFLPIF